MAKPNNQHMTQIPQVTGQTWASWGSEALYFTYQFMLPDMQYLLLIFLYIFLFAVFVVTHLMHNNKYYVNLHSSKQILVTVFISVDSELATSTKTSASRQNLSIQLSSCDVTSVPGLQSGREVKRSNAWHYKICEVTHPLELDFYSAHYRSHVCKSHFFTS